MLHRKDESRVKEVWYCVQEDKAIDRADLVKGYEYKKGKYIVVEDEELKKVAPATANAMEILQFVKAADVDPVIFEKSYYVAPEKAGEKPYALLKGAMADTGFYAIAKVAMHNREHIVIIRPHEDGLILHTMYFANELHRANKAPKSSVAKSSTKELDLAKQLIQGLAAPFRLEQFHDQYHLNVEKLIAQKRKGQPVTPAEQPETKPVIDIMDALRQSLENHSKTKQSGKKPVRRRSRAA
jgi:DNA end-binding protein Ku